jgi:hypothetical protein
MARVPVSQRYLHPKEPNPCKKVIEFEIFVCFLFGNYVFCSLEAFRKYVTRERNSEQRTVWSIQKSQHDLCVLRNLPKFQRFCNKFQVERKCRSWWTIWNSRLSLRKLLQHFLVCLRTFINHVKPTAEKNNSVAYPKWTHRSFVAFGGCREILCTVAVRAQGQSFAWLL